MLTKTQYFPVGCEGRIGYDDSGGIGPLVVAIPGMGDLRSQYRDVRPSLINAGYRVVTMDIRGHGDSSTDWPDYSARAIASDVLGLIRHLDAGPAAILGNSFAAGSALWAAQASPRDVNGIVLLGPVVRDGKTTLLTKLALKIGFAGPWRVAFWLAYWNSLFPMVKPADHAEAKQALSANLRQPGRMKALQKMVELSKSETQAILTNNRTTSLIVMGTSDPDFPNAKEEARWLGKLIGTHPILIEGAGHYPHLETPEQVLPALLDFLKHLTWNQHTN